MKVNIYAIIIQSESIDIKIVIIRTDIIALLFSVLIPR